MDNSMSKKADNVSLVDLLRSSPVVWAKPDRHFDVMEHIATVGAVVLFEDEYVVAYDADNDDDREDATNAGEPRITIAPKLRVPSLLDIGVADAQLSAHLLFALQQVAYKLSLHKTGFEVRCNVLPPYQRRPHLSLQIRTGEPKKSNLVS